MAKLKIVTKVAKVDPKVRSGALDMCTRPEVDALLVLGSSLQTWSAFRLCRAAKETGKKLIVVNIGKTRADDIADIKIEARCGDILSRVEEIIV